MTQPDILVFMSDQHGAVYSGWGDVKVDTPVLDTLRAEGTSFEAAYTSCPLCVPARMSMMSGRLPGKTGITGNMDTLANTIPCFTHTLAAAGYETVLIGRMHFVGMDQRHGFTKRLAPDFTPVSWGFPKEMAKERGLLMGTTGEPWCCDIVGAGESMVIHYDNMILEKTLEYLAEDHEKPQFIVVGTYGPHFPYIADEDLYQKYYERAQMPNFFAMGDEADYLESINVLTKRRKPESVTWEVARGCLAAYCGQIEKMDSQIGTVQKAFEDYTKRNHHKAVFSYLSDHGDQVGEHRVFGKQTFFEKSSRIPLIFKGDMIAAGKLITDPVSIIDLGVTICELADTTFKFGDGVSLIDYFSADHALHPDRLVLSQSVDGYQGKRTAGVMVRWKNYKWIRYRGYEAYDMLFDLDKDPGETVNIRQENLEVADWMAAEALKLTDLDEMEQLRVEHDEAARLFQRFEAITGIDDSERWKDNPPTARGQLTITAAYRNTMPDMGTGYK